MVDAQLVHYKVWGRLMSYPAQYGRCLVGSLQSLGKVDVLSGPVWSMPNWFITKPTGTLQITGKVDVLFSLVWSMPNWFITKSGED